VLAIPKLLGESRANAILLDDAFHHRAVAPGLSIILSDYSRMFTRDFLLPFGRLREWRNSYKRADIIIITKCPDDLTEAEREKLTQEVNPYPHQKIYFSYLKYSHPVWAFDKTKYFKLNNTVNAISFCGIANPNHFENYIKKQVNRLHTISFDDHHPYEITDFDPIKEAFDTIKGTNKLVITTEKDYQRLTPFLNWFKTSNIPLFYLPVNIYMKENEKNGLKKAVINFIESHYNN
jgi:tetraacyldisaccharide 4'-kinase